MPRQGSSKNQNSTRHRRNNMNNNNSNSTNNSNNTNTEEIPLVDSKQTGDNKKRTPDRVKVFGFDVSNYLRTSPTLVFISFSLCHIAFSIVFAGLQEIVNGIDGFKFPEFMTIIQTATYTLCAFLEMKSMKGELGYVTSPKSPVWKYCVLSFMTFGGMYCTNSGLKYVSYPTRIIFKAGKPLPTMGIEGIFGDKKFSGADILNVLILTCGITLFCYGEARGLPSFDGLGILFMSAGVLLDSMTSNYEKKSIFKAHNASHAEAMFFASLMGTLWSFIILVVTDYSRMLQAIAFCISNPTALCWLFLSSIGGYMSVVFILLLIKCFSTTYTECVKGIRKVLSIAFSYLFISDGNKSFNSFHAYGMGLFTCSILISIFMKMDYNHASQFMSRSRISR